MPDGDTVLNKRDTWSSNWPTIIDHMVDPGLLTKLSDGNGNSALHIVCKSRVTIECLERLLDNGLDPNLPNNDSETALHIATASMKLNVVKLLLDRGADIPARTTEGLTALNIAAKLKADHESKSELLNLLLPKSRS